MGRSQLEGPFGADLSQFPLMRILSPNVAQFDQVSIPSYFECLDLGLARQTTFAILHDARALPHVDDVRRHAFVDAVDQRRTQIVRHVTAYAGLVSSPLERGTLTAFMWFIKLPFPIRLFTNESEARLWLLSRVKAANDASAASAAQG